LRPIEPAQASLPYCSIRRAEPDVVTLSSSDSEEALEVLSLSPAHDLTSQLSEGDVLEPSSNSGSDLFEDWPKANNMSASIYVALTAEASSSRASMADAPRGEQRTHTGSSSTRQPRSLAALLWRSRWWKTKDGDAPCRKSKRTKKSVVESSSAVHPPCGSQLSADNFDSSKWEIMYPHFVEEGLVDPPDRAHK
jgi:hypothetical protein